MRMSRFAAAGDGDYGVDDRSLGDLMIAVVTIITITIIIII